VYILLSGLPKPNLVVGGLLGKRSVVDYLSGVSFRWCFLLRWQADELLLLLRARLLSHAPIPVCELASTSCLDTILLAVVTDPLKGRLLGRLRHWRLSLGSWKLMACHVSRITCRVSPRGLLSLSINCLWQEVGRLVLANLTICTAALLHRVLILPLNDYIWVYLPNFDAVGEVSLLVNNYLVLVLLL